MAKRAILALALMWVGLSTGGCASDGRKIVETLPPPTFDGPRVAGNQTPAPLLHIDPAPTRTARPAAVARGSVPRDWVPAAAVPTRPWRWIVIHHSATPGGGARAFDRMHRDKGWDELGYHFVIGNGSDTADGAIEVGTRWPKQKYGAHCKTPDNQFNDFGIGICLVGNFDDSRPTAAQMRSLTRLTSHLMRTYRVPPSRVIGHSDAKATDCPGRNVSIASIRRAAAQVAGATNSPEEPTLAQGELLVDVASDPQ